MKRVVVTGMGAITPIGTGWDAIKSSLTRRFSGVEYLPAWAEIDSMTSHLGAPVKDFETPSNYNRKKLRTMGKVSIMAVRATEMALIEADLLNSPRLEDGMTGVAYGSTNGSTRDAISFMKSVGIDKSLKGVAGSTFVKFMTHTCAANLSLFYNLKGRLISTTTACTSGSQAIGYGYESIKSGAQDIMICGGSEELDPLGTAVFDIMYATSSRNDSPKTTPKPFDKDRDGLVVGEGAGTLVLESLESAQKRGANIIAEIIGYATNTDGSHMVNPSKDGMQRVIELAIKDAKIDSAKIDYVCAHGTATEIGDIAETNATEGCFKREVPISSIKSYMGHTLGACGAIEAFVTIRQMNENWVFPTLNLENVDPACGKLDYIKDVRNLEQDCVMSNNFAFGGVNTSLIFKKWHM
ncbi:MAG: beta-ketoacyl-ACP synthase [Deltaproteobacteria bacterium]|nr:beta-ketoacyl-ACP synthase [Deltaproteobacteria bacterium]